MSPEQKANLLKRLSAGRAKVKAARDDAKSKGMPDPKPRKARAKKVKNEAVVEPMANKPARETIAPIDGAPAGATNAVAALPVDPEVTVTSKIDVPNLPDKKGRKMIEKNAEEVPEAKGPKELSTTGTTKGYDDNVMIRSEETGNQVIPAQYPGQEESIKKLLKKSKLENRPLAPKSVPDPPEKTVRNVFRHVPDLKAVEGRAPFSFSAIRKQLYQ
jgi:hypothetical protein